MGRHQVVVVVGCVAVALIGLLWRWRQVEPRQVRDPITTRADSSGVSSMNVDDRNGKGSEGVVGGFNDAVWDNIVEPDLAERAPTQQDYIERVQKQISYCGHLCYVDESTLTNETFYVTVPYLKEKMIKKEVRCDTFFSKRAESLYDAKPFEWPPPRDLSFLYQHFLFKSRAVEKRYKAANYGGGDAKLPIWSMNTVQTYLAQLANRTLPGSYGSGQTMMVYDLLKQKANPLGLNVLVVGSEMPWLEIMCIQLGAKTVTTLEYGRIQSEHPQILTITPPELNEKYRQGLLEPFDMVISYSSLEHSGLGRYGDAINPWGDVIWMAKISCMVKPNGVAVIGLPNTSKDYFYYNIHRGYGPWRWPLFLTNWETYEFSGGSGRAHGIAFAMNKRSSQ